jgi:hypothetical protein
MAPSDFRRALLLELHRAVDDAANSALDTIGKRGTAPVYPPGVEFTPEEVAALAELRVSPAARSALDKLLRDTAASPLFEFFSLIDGVSDPHDWPGPEPWLGALLRARVATDRQDEREGNAEMWHDQFFESYWEYRGGRGPDD